MKNSCPALLPQYFHLFRANVPMVIKEAVNLYGTYEWAGRDNNPVILEWAKEIGRKAGMDYNADSIPWCGLFTGICVKRAGFDLPNIAVRATAWLNFGDSIWVDDAMIGDILVFSRSGGGHVGFYVGEDDTHFHVLGGNQSDQVNIRRLEKSRCLGVRRCPYGNDIPYGVKKVKLAGFGKVSDNEA